MLKFTVKTSVYLFLHAEQSTGYTHSLNHNTENLLTLHFNGKNLKKCNFSKDQRGLSEDGPYGLKYVGASIQMF
jgi:hypothetical protein